ncbi:glycosyltransferase [Streptococcus uberis]|uniref:glycosyltransferase n=1 Tax=Streptococcus uberis TaxID=1349 RepID=UPI000DFACD29|nr:glycosyltransferase [Streptococcus uberis]SUO91400.1 capsular polysaccharide biosynthesis protein Cps4G [Streptococcus uberis]
MKKVCILSAVNIKHMSLISIYTEELKKREIDFDIIYMDKYGEEEAFPAKNKYVFTNKINSKLPKFFRGLYYLKFISYAKSILKRNQYDFIIVWNDVAILLFGLYLARNWKNKYCLNVRDYCYENIKMVYNIFDTAIKNAAFTTISSPGYEEFLPPANYIHLHSLNKEVLKKTTVRTELRSVDEKIRITFIGYVRFFDINKRLLDIFKNDDRFELHYYGPHSEILKQYADEKGISNAVFGGSFPVEDTFKYINKTDIINNLYGHGDINVDLALSIKLYYGLYNYIPILVEPETYMEKVTQKSGMGYVVESLSDDLNEKIYQWYRSLNFENLKNKCDIELIAISEQNEMFTQQFEKYLTDEKMESQ